MTVLAAADFSMVGLAGRKIVQVCPAGVKIYCTNPRFQSVTRCR
jgi:hypothetical protein